MKTRSFATDHTESSATSFQIRTAETVADWQIAHQMLDEEHLLGAGREAGDRLCQFILEEGEIVAVLIWSAAAWHLKDRDKMIGWDPVTRNALLAIIPFDEKHNLPSLIAEYQHDKTRAINFILHAK